MSNWIDKIELEGEKVKLTPLKKSHKDELLKAASDGNYGLPLFLLLKI
jgi:hypothetical protein